jgi:hypothetical protein
MSGRNKRKGSGGRVAAKKGSADRTKKKPKAPATAPAPRVRVPGYNENTLATVANVIAIDIEATSVNAAPIVPSQQQLEVQRESKQHVHAHVVESMSEPTVAVIAAAAAAGASSVAGAAAAIAAGAESKKQADKLDKEKKWPPDEIEVIVGGNDKTKQYWRVRHYTNTIHVILLTNNSISCVVKHGLIGLGVHYVVQMIPKIAYIIMLIMQNAIFASAIRITKKLHVC